jgi:uncharacterized protein YkwD
MRLLTRSACRSFSWLAALLIPIASTSGQETKPKEPGPTVAVDPADATLAELLAAHNKVRADEKRPPLKLNARLTEAARAHARDMAEHEQMSHEGSDGSLPKQRIEKAAYVYKEIGENVAAGQETVPEVMRTWIESPPHRESILGPFTEMGGAVAKDAEGKNYWCVDFGRPIPPVDAAKSPDEMIAALNKARSDAKKRPLKHDAALARVAARFARGAAERKSLETKDRDGKSPFDILQHEGYRSRRFAVTLAYGEGDPAKVVAAWLEEPQDREALLSRFDRVGVGVATDDKGVPFWVLLLAEGAGR